MTTSWHVVFSPQAQEQLAELYRYIAAAASPRTAASYTEAILDYCEGLSTLPHRGTKRDDIRSGLRVINYRKRTMISFTVSDTTVSVLGIFYGGQNFEIRN